MHHEKGSFIVDAPILNKDEDTLGRKEFANQLSAAIIGWMGNESLIVGLNGPWGSGKTSVKNMVMESISESCYYYEYNPWILSGKDAIVTSFFYGLGESFGKKDKKKIYQKRSALFEYYGEILNGGKIVTSSLKTLKDIFITILVVCGVNAIVVPSEITPYLFVLTLASIIFLLLTNCGSAIVKFFGNVFAQKAIVESMSIEELKEQINDDLKKLKKPIVIAIDDVDRLNDSEINDIFQLVKVNADFPNTRYLLLFDRERVIRALNEKHGDGNRYLEKIIQVHVDVPSVDLIVLRRYLCWELDKLFKAQSVSDKFDSERWGYMLKDGFFPFFKTIRDVKRYISSLNFYAAGFLNNDCFEVNAIDLFYIEVLRVFEPELYAKIIYYKNIVVGTVQNASDEKKNKKREAMKNDLLSKVSREHTIPAQYLLSNLFPSISSCLEHYYVGSESENELFTDLRVCHKDIFDKYFVLVSPVNALTQKEIEDLLSARAKYEEFMDAWNRYIGQGKIDYLMNAMENYKENGAVDDNSDFMRALMDIYEEMPDSAPAFEFSHALTIYRLFYWQLKCTNQDVKFSRIISAFKKSNGISLVARFILSENSSRQKNETPLLSQSEFNELFELFVLRFNKSCASDPKQVFFSNFSRDIIYAWFVIDNEGLRDFLLKQQRLNILVVLRGLIGEVRDMSGIVTRRYFKHTEFSDFLDVNLLKSQLANVVIENLTDAEKELVQLARDSLLRLDSGGPDDPL